MIEKETLQVIEIFSSIQGETSHSGRMTSFVRLAGCHLRCAYCDSTYSFAKGKKLSFSSLLKKLTSMGWKEVCVTGGEPLLQKKCVSFLECLLENNFEVSLETNGALSTKDVPPSVRIILDIKCPGSGMMEKIIWENLDHIRQHDEVKFVIVDRQDYEWSKEVIKNHNLFEKVGNVLISPAWGKLPPQELIEWLKEDKFPARVNLQIHKYVWKPSQRGV
jgi:7-carboxy-7-deazaguanine synthase